MSEYKKILSHKVTLTKDGRQNIEFEIEGDSEKIPSYFIYPEEITHERTFLTQANIYRNLLTVVRLNGKLINLYYTDEKWDWSKDCVAAPLPYDYFNQKRVDIE
jgi:hypothetical protein